MHAKYRNQNGKTLERWCLDTEGEFDADIDVAGHLDDFGELDGFLGGGLEVVDGEDLQAGFVDLRPLVSNLSFQYLHKYMKMSYQLVCLLHVGTLQPSNNRCPQVHGLDD